MDKNFFFIQKYLKTNQQSDENLAVDFSLQESASGIAAFETIPRKINKKIFKEHGNQFHFQNMKHIIDDPQYNNLIFLTRDKKDWVGYVTYGLSGKAIYNLEVNPKYRRMGYGKKLLECFPQFEQLYVLKDNIPACSLYDRIGLKLSNIFSYDKYNKSPNNIIFYNPKTVPNLYSYDKEKNICLNITIPKDLYYFIKGFINNNNKYIPINNLVKKIKHSKNPTTELIPTSKENQYYIVLNNIDKHIPLTLNYNNPLTNNYDIIHESMMFNI